jgi:hypothetical protein
MLWPDGHVRSPALARGEARKQAFIQEGGGSMIKSSVILAVLSLALASTRSGRSFRTVSTTNWALDGIEVRRR